ncbi:ABC transporter permease, partial [uncultured Trichococcus sp.]|uniref:ABC transporter permease n=1 Tax=uncultured Trichococcus sp. TaxID=189665 RepID=UPI002591FAB6
MIPIIGRNIKIFFRDKANVFFSLLAVLIIIGLYVFFLGKNLTSALGDSVGAQYVMDSWIMSGVISVSGVTTTMGAFAVMIDDRANKILKDFTVSPIRSSRLAGAYILSSVVVGFIMSLVTFVLAEAYIFLNGGELLAQLAILKMLGLILLTVLTSSAMVYFLTSFFQSQNAFATASTILGTIIGFLAGVYVPIGQFSDSVQTIIKLFPMTYSASLMRQVMMEEPLDISFEGAPVEALDAFKLMMGH